MSPYYPRIGGIETHVRCLAELLIKREHIVHIVARYAFKIVEEDGTLTTPLLPAAFDEVSEGLVIHRLAERRAFSENFIRSCTSTAKKVVAETDLDVLHAHCRPDFGAAAVNVKREMQIPLLSTIHFPLSELKWLGILEQYGPTVRDIVSNSDMITSPSRKVVNELIDFTGSPQNLFRVIPNGVDTLKFNPAVKGISIRESYGIRHEPVVLFVGRAFPMKGLQYLICAAHQVLEELPETKFLIVGGGFGIEEYVYLCERLGIRNSFVFRARVPEEDIPRYYAASDVFVLPSIAGENLPITILEAMASGKPVIASNLSGIPEEVEDGSSGLLVQPRDVTQIADAIIKILSNEELAQEMGKRGREIVETKFTVDRMVKQTLDAYETIKNAVI